MFEPTHPSRRAALWAAIVTLAASVAEYIPDIYARWHQLDFFNMPLGYSLMARVSEILLTPVALIAYAGLWIVGWIWAHMEDTWLALLRMWHTARGVKQTGLMDRTETFRFSLSDGWMMPLVWLFYFALFSIVFRFLSRKRAQAPLIRFRQPLLLGLRSRA